jgi:(4S)-4-hydroxy-5-phosphonooxypentane-2,3-dione isomerase
VPEAGSRLFWTSELDANDAAIDAHRGSDAMPAAAPTLGELIADSEVIIGEPVSAKGVPA